VHLIGFIIKEFVTMRGHMIVKLVHLIGFIIKEFVTIHGLMNVKLVHLVGFIIKKFVTMRGHMKASLATWFIQTEHERAKHYIYLIHALTQHNYTSFRLLVSTHYPDHHHMFPKTNLC
jgi:hypothetical protein